MELDLAVHIFTSSGTMPRVKDSHPERTDPCVHVQIEELCGAISLGISTTTDWPRFFRVPTEQRLLCTVCPGGFRTILMAFTFDKG